MTKKVYLLFVLFCLPAVYQEIAAQSCYWIGFTDKKQSVYSVNKPYEFLSERSIQRRYRQSIPFDGTDLPVNKNYTDSVLKIGATLLNRSRWLNGITVSLRVDSLTAKIRKLSFVKEVQLTRPPDTLKSASLKFEVSLPSGGPDPSVYGKAVFQVGQLNGQFLHQKNMKGKGIQIAVLDAGFLKADVLPAFDSLWHEHRILGVHDFVNPKSNIFEEHYHGMSVLSTMGGNIPGELIGTAPEASYWLLRSEDADSEYLIEEDNWAAAAEFADSVGADIINTSLGYYTFNLSQMNHSYSDMNGHTTHVAKAANFASAKGMLVFASAGNEGNKTWLHIITPADADSVIAVGAVGKDSIRAAFSSVGPASDGDIKPDLAAMGLGTAVEDTGGKVVSGNGTSFSSPVLAGMAACLWQAFPNSTSSRIKQALLRSGHMFQHPDTLLGYGIPNMQIASALLEKYSISNNVPLQSWSVFPNPFHSTLFIFSIEQSKNKTEVEVINLSGIVVFRKSLFGSSSFSLDGLDSLPCGIYLLSLSSENGREVHKIIKGKLK